MKKFSLYILFTFIAVLTAGLSSCSETSNEPEEYPDWRKTNDTYFENKYAEVKQYVSSGSTEWKIIRSWSLEENAATQSYDNILVNVLKTGTGSGCPIFTDSVKVHYTGRLIPSRSYPEGYQFDKSWTGDFVEGVSHPAKFYVGGLVDGFSTALQYMHIGDKWRVYVPYQLGYDSGTNVGPAYSTLIFDVELVAYYHANSTSKNAPALNGSREAPRGQWIYE